MLLCDTERGPIVAVVDKVESVLELKPEDVDYKPPVQSKVDQNYLIGVAKIQERLVSLVDLHKLLNEGEYKAA
jgi:purine-binding chemotaxis protein CheW